MRQEVWGWGINLFERSHQSNYTTNTVERWIPYRGWIKKNSEKEREKELKKENIIRIVVNIPIQLEVESGLSVRPLIEDQTMLAFFLVHFACYVMHTHICFPYDAVVLSNFHVFYTLLWFGILFMAHPCTTYIVRPCLMHVYIHHLLLSTSRCIFMLESNWVIDFLFFASHLSIFVAVASSTATFMMFI